jgi:hypothetical protein
MLFTRNRCQLRFRWNTSSSLQYCHFVKIQKSFERLLRGGNGRRVFSCKDHQAKQRDGGWIPKKHEGFFVKLSVLHPCSTNLKEVSTDLYGWSVVEEHLKKAKHYKKCSRKVSRLSITDLTVIICTQCSLLALKWREWCSNELLCASSISKCLPNWVAILDFFRKHNKRGKFGIVLGKFGNRGKEVLNTQICARLSACHRRSPVRQARGGRVEKEI